MRRRSRSSRLMRADGRVATVLHALLLPADLPPSRLPANLHRRADALALVRLGLAGRADLGGGPTSSLSCPRPSGGRGLELELMPAGGSISSGGCRRARAQLVALLLRAVAHADDLEALPDPSVTPTTMLLTRVPGRPCEALVELLLRGRRDHGRLTSCCSIHAGQLAGRARPRTLVIGLIRPSSVTSTPAGTAMESRPMRDIVVTRCCARISPPSWACWPAAGHDPLGHADDGAPRPPGTRDVGLLRVTRRPGC